MTFLFTTTAHAYHSHPRPYGRPFAGTSAKQKAVQDLAAAAPALYCSLPTMTLLGSAKVEQQCKKNPASQNREEDNFGHHAGHLGWIKCRRVAGSGKNDVDAAFLCIFDHDLWANG
jgi:hypothetical protein